MDLWFEKHWRRHSSLVPIEEDSPGQKEGVMPATLFEKVGKPGGIDGFRPTYLCQFWGLCPPMPTYIACLFLYICRDRPFFPHFFDS